MKHSAPTACLEARLAHGLLVSLLVLLPALLWTGATNAFEYPKLWLLHLGALTLAALERALERAQFFRVEATTSTE